MREIFNAGALASAPADKQIPAGSQDRTGLFFEVYNLSPYAFELQDDEQNIRGVVGPFDYAVVSLEEFSFTQNVVLHYNGATMAAASQPIASTGWILYAGLTKQPLKGFRVS